MASIEQEARDLLERMEVDGAQSYSAGEIVELANVIHAPRKLVAHILNRIAFRANMWLGSCDHAKVAAAESLLDDVKVIAFRELGWVPPSPAEAQHEREERA